MLLFPCLDQQAPPARGGMNVPGHAPPNSRELLSCLPSVLYPSFSVSPHRYRPRTLGTEVRTLAHRAHALCVLLGTQSRELWTLVWLR